MANEIENLTFLKLNLPTKRNGNMKKQSLACFLIFWQVQISKNLPNWQETCQKSVVRNDPNDQAKFQEKIGNTFHKDYKTFYREALHIWQVFRKYLTSYVIHHNAIRFYSDPSQQQQQQQKSNGTPTLSME